MSKGQGGGTGGGGWDSAKEHRATFGAKRSSKSKDRSKSRLVKHGFKKRKRKGKA